MPWDFTYVITCSSSWKIVVTNSLFLFLWLFPLMKYAMSCQRAIESAEWHFGWKHQVHTPCQLPVIEGTGALNRCTFDEPCRIEGRRTAQYYPGWTIQNKTKCWPVHKCHKKASLYHPLHSTSPRIPTHRSNMSPHPHPPFLSHWSDKTWAQSSILNNSMIPKNGWEWGNRFVESVTHCTGFWEGALDRQCWE